VGAEIWQARCVTFDGRVFVVLGGAGVAGECVTEALLGAGATVAVPSRSPDRLADLQAWLDTPNLHPFGYRAPDELVEVADDVAARLGPIDGVVASLGGWWEGSPVLAIGDDRWAQVIADNLTSHVVAARTFLPRLVDRPGAVYLTLNGIAADRPVAGAGPICVTGAGQRMLLRVLAEELRGTRVRLHEIAIGTPVVTRHWDGRPIRPGWLTGTEVGAFVAGVASVDFPAPDRLLLAIPDPPAG
jgi:NAD(P)-dependent dehydrogenase (short-subunit alcohol dehydrogenase family)